MIPSFFKTFRQINDPKILKILGLATLFTFFSVILSLTFGISLLDSLMDFYSGTLQSWFGKGENWFRAFAQFLSGSLLLFIAYFFFAGIHGAFVSIFIDDILDAVHLKHYPDQPWQKAPSISRSILFSLRILLLTLVWNFVCSPILILGWFIPPVGLTVQILLNGYLLGKEYGQLVEYRIPQNQSVSSTPKYFTNGMIAAIIWIVPVVNLLAPILLAGSILHTRVRLE